ncbi:iron uptake porin [Coleofasciculus sp. LEGE 07092]|nr:iron uptake porin [Coleofasciculus sp. LEGE 07081]MBE9151018.1 iron uptake porin [Coleofasciculus sp. LEGE 07092]
MGAGAIAITVPAVATTTQPNPDRDTSALVRENEKGLELPDVSSIATQPKISESSVADILSKPAVISDTGLIEGTLAEVGMLVLPLDEEEVPVSTEQTEKLAQVAEIPNHTGDSSLIEKINRYSNESSTNSLDQVTNVSQLRDVSPGDWAYEALRSLVERYGCIAGYPDGTYRGNRALTRYEFAAGLNACLQQIERLIAGNGGVDGGDLETLRRLIQEFEAELATLGARVDNLEGRVAFLEDHQFSTTTKLEGQVIFGLGSVITGEDADGNDIDKVPVFGNRTRLELLTSFTGEDLLFTRLATGNFPEFSEVTGTFEGEIGFAQPDDNDVGLEVLYYRFPVGEKTNVWIAASGGASDDFASTVNLLDGDGAEGAVSLFGTRNPIYYPFGDAGIGITTQLSDRLELSVGYQAGEASEPSEDNGLFNGPYSALAQVLFQPFERLNIGLTYLHGYNQLDTGTGSRLSNFRSFSDALTTGDEELVPTSSNSYGVELSWRLSNRFVLGGWAGYTQATTLSTLNGQIDRGDLDIWNWAVTLGFPDLGKEGNLAGIIVGMEPKVTGSSVERFGGGTFEDEDTSLHVEAFYQYQVTDNIAITPGVIWITAPDHNSDNSDLVIGTIRTTFSF